MENLKIKKIQKGNLLNELKCVNICVCDTNVFKHLLFDIGLFNKSKVDMEYFGLYIGNIKIGSGVAVYKDKRKNFEFEYERMIANLPMSCMIKNCVISRRYRGFGLFTKFFSAMVERVKEKGCREIVIGINESNVSVINIFQHYGFVKEFCVFDKVEGCSYRIMKKII